MRCYSIALARDGFGVLGMSLSQQIAAITALVSLGSEKEAATVVKKSAGRKAALARWQGRKHFREPQIGSWTSSPSHSLIVAVDGSCFGVNKARVDQVPPWSAHRSVHVPTNRLAGSANFRTSSLMPAS